jgi:hypothetical protein
VPASTRTGERESIYGGISTKVNSHQQGVIDRKEQEVSLLVSVLSQNTLFSYTDGILDIRVVSQMLIL